MAPSAIEDYQREEEIIRELPKKGASGARPAWADPVSFGGNDRWYYLPESKLFDLSRGSEKKLILEADDGIRHHKGVMIDPESTVLVIVDMQNYFLHPACCDHPGGLATVEPTIKVIKRCRKEGIQVAWLNWGITEDDLIVMPPCVQRGFSRNLIQGKGYGWHVGLGAELPENQGRCLFKGTWNADIYGPLRAVMEENDVRFDKTRMSGMWNSSEAMHRYLIQTGKKTLMFTGVNTDQCVMGTLIDSYNWGWDCILLGDCTATTTGFNASLLCDYNVAKNYGFVSDSDSLVNAGHLRVAKAFGSSDYAEKLSQDASSLSLLLHDSGQL